MESVIHLLHYFSIKVLAAHTWFFETVKRYQVQQESKHNAYHCLKVLLIQHPRKVLIVIHDKLDHCKFVSHYFVSKNKETNIFIKLPLFVKSWWLMDIEMRDMPTMYRTCILKLQPYCSPWEWSKTRKYIRQ